MPARPPARRRRGAAAGSQSSRESSRLARVALVAGEALVAAVAVERDGDVCAGAARRGRRRAPPTGRRTARRSGARPGGGSPPRPARRPARGARWRTSARPAARAGSSLQALLVEADREGLDGLWRLLGHRRDDRRRVDPAGEEGAERDVGDHPPAHGPADQLSRIALELGLRGRRRLARVVQLPVALDPETRRRVDERRSPAAACGRPRRRSAARARSRRRGRRRSRGGRSRAAPRGPPSAPRAPRRS